MSGDVQPKKRRDKKKRKDDEDLLTQRLLTPPQAPKPPPFAAHIEEETIHVHKDDGTGGGWCAKIIFFILLGALAVLIGLIFTEHRGLTDLDSIETESRFSQIFEGWVDKAPDDHGEHDEYVLESTEHDDEHDEHEEDDDHEIQHDEEEHEASEEEEEQEYEHGESDEEDAHDHDDERDEEDDEHDDAQSVQEDEESVQEEDDDEKEESQQDDEQSDEQSDEYNIQAEIPSVEDIEDSDEIQVFEGIIEEFEEPAMSNEDDDEDDDDDDAEVIETLENRSDNDNDDDEDNDNTGADSPALDHDEVAPDVEDRHDEDDDDEDGDIDVITEAHGTEAEEGGEDLTNAGDKLNETKAHVEVQKDLLRRNTIVVPPKAQKILQVFDLDEEYSEDDNSVDEDEVKMHPVKVGASYQQLRHTYERSLTPESETDNVKQDEEDYEDEEEDDNEYDDDEEAEGELGADEELGDEEEELVEEEEIDEGLEEEEPLSEEVEDDDDLMKKLEAKYGKMPNEDEDVEEEEEEVEDDDYDEESDEENYQWKKTAPVGEAAYKNQDVTNSDDHKIKDILDDADRESHNVELALLMYNNILDRHPRSPRALYGKGKCLETLADRRRSNPLLEEVVDIYVNLMTLPNVPLVLFQRVAERTITKTRFLGHYSRTISTQLLLLSKFPENTTYYNQLAVTYLTVNKISDARKTLRETLDKWPNDGFALAHYGFILKVNDNNLVKGIEYLKAGIATHEVGVIDGRFYFHLGDALTRLGRLGEAKEIYKDGVKNNVFLSEFQRSLYNVDRLTARPWWNKQQTPQHYLTFYNQLERNYKQILSEGLAVLNQKGFFKDEAENLRDVGDWKQFELYARGIKHVKNCNKCPFTCSLIETLYEARSCRRGQVKFSVMHPKTHVWPHCGPTNCRLRVHLGLKVPPNTHIRVAEETRSWTEGKVLIFDDSFEHEVWHNGTEVRLVLIVDVWHPELTTSEKKTLSAI